MLARLLLLGLAVTLAGCGDQEPSNTLAQRAAGLSAAMNIDTVLVNGEPTALQFQPIAGASFPVPFDARMPRPIRFGIPTDDEYGTAVAFKMGQAPTDAQLRVVAFPEAFDEAAARAEVQRLAQGIGAATGSDANAPAWAIESASVAAGGRTGFVWLGEHAGRYIAVVSDMADEARAEFAPRREYLLRSWTWTDDGTTLLP